MSAYDDWKCDDSFEREEDEAHDRDCDCETCVETRTPEKCWRCRGVGRLVDLENLNCPKCGGSGES